MKDCFIQDDTGNSCFHVDHFIFRSESSGRSLCHKGQWPLNDFCYTDFKFRGTRGQCHDRLECLVSNLSFSSDIILEETIKLTGFQVLVTSSPKVSKMTLELEAVMDVSVPL